MWGETESEPFSPEQYLALRHPRWRIVDRDLDGPLLGCLDFTRNRIYLQQGVGPVIRRSTLAYEIGQLEHGPAPRDPMLAAARQRAAIDWAARMLIPTPLFVAAWQVSLDLAELAAFCGVDLPMFRARIRAGTDHEQDVVMEAIAQYRLSA